MRRPDWIVVQGVRISIAAHDAAYRRRWQALKAAQIAAHPDSPGGGHKRSVMAQRRFGAWLAQERQWYATFGMDPPDGRRTFDRPVRAALGSRPRTFREIVREALMEALSQSRSLNDAARRLGLSPAWVRGHCKRYGVNWRACLAAYRIARATFYQQAIAQHGSEQAAAVRLGMSRQTLRRAVAQRAA